MSSELETITEPGIFAQEVRQIYTRENLTVDQLVKIGHLGGGVLQLAEVIFPSAVLSQLHAEIHTRESRGRGAHFDVYDPTLDEKYPYLGLFNLSGEVEVTVAALPDDLAETYARRFPEPNDAAYQARRDFSSIALGVPDAEVFTGSLVPGSSLVIAQKPDSPHIIHNIVPKDPHHPGEFIKLVKTNSLPSTTEVVSKTGMMSLDRVVTETLGYEENLEEPVVDFDPDQVWLDAGGSGGARAPIVRGIVRRLRHPQSDDESYSRCNLD